MQEDEDKIFDENPIGIEVSVKPKKNIIRSALRFIKKHKYLSIIIVLLISLLIALYFFIPVIYLKKQILVNLDTSFKITKDKIAKHKYENVKVEIISFTNDVCPVPNTCFGSGKTTAVEYALYIDNIKYATGSETPAIGSKYQIETISSDYTSYAVVKIIKNK